MPNCKQCGASIIFIKTVNGMSMPCDAQITAYRYQHKANRKIVTPEGRVLPCVLDGQFLPSMGYVPHWATCPRAGDFKRPAPDMEQITMPEVHYDKT